MIIGVNDVTSVLSIWRSPIDRVAVAEAESLQRRQPQCTIVYGEDFTQITMYNYGQYITAAGGIANADAALDLMFGAMNPSTLYGFYGGLAYITQQEFSVNAYDPILKKHEVPDQCNILGAGTGGSKANGMSTPFYHFTITPMATGSSISQFLTCEGNHTTGGKWFRGLSFKWLQTNAKAGDICISAGTWNCRAIDCTFTDCPTAFYAIGESAGLEQCLINYTTGSPNDAVAVYLQGPQAYVVGPSEYLQDSVASGGPTGCTAIALGGGGGAGNLVHGVISTIHLSNWSYAINYNVNPGVNGTHITNVQAQAYATCVNMQPPSVSNNQINGEKYTGCTFEKAPNSVMSTAIVFIDTNGGGNNTINDIEFTDCSVYSQAGFPAGGYCYQISSGSNIRIIGGTASNAGNGLVTAGIAITTTAISGGPPGPGRITVLGVDLNSSYPQTGGGPSAYALFVSANLQDVVTIDNCRMTNYSASPIYITGTVNNYLYIRNCEGYNDRNTSILSGTSSLPITSPVSAATASSLTGGTDYYGPSLVVFTNNASSNTFTINGTISQTVPAHGFVTLYLASPYDTIQFGHTLSAFSWIGK